MDIIHQCLSLAPVPYLDFAFSVFEFIWTSVEQAQASKQQLHALAQTIAQLLSTLNKEYCAGRLVQADTSTPVAELGRFVRLTAPYILDSYLCPLHRLLEDISAFVQKETGLSRVKADVTSRTARPDGGSTAGSRNWMAPERLLGASLKNPCKIYANEIPLGHVNYADFIDLVVQRNV